MKLKVQQKTHCLGWVNCSDVRTPDEATAILEARLMKRDYPGGDYRAVKTSRPGGGGKEERVVVLWAS
jgi:hypothetical protein